MSRVVTVLPNGGFFEGTVDEFLDWTKGYFSSFYSYIEKWSNIMDILNPNMCTSEKVSFDSEWRTDAEMLYNDKKFHDEVLLGKNYEILKTSIKEFFIDSDKLTLLREPTRPEIPVMKYPSLVCDSTADKAQEVIYYTYAIDVILQSLYKVDDPIFHGEAKHKEAEELLSKLKVDFEKKEIKRDDIKLIDVGAGKGYLSIFLANELRISTLPIEASLNHSKALLDRIGVLVSMKRAQTEKFDKLKMCIGYVTKNTNVESIVTNAISYDKWIVTMCSIDNTPLRFLHRKLIPPNTTETPLALDNVVGEQSTKPRNIQGELAVEITAVEGVDLSPAKVFCVSIHACGDLSVVSHEVALRCEQCCGAISCPCCFQHLSPQNCPLMRENDKTFELLFHGDMGKRKDFLNHSLSAYFVTFEKHREIVSHFIPREIISAFIPPRVSVKKIKQGKSESYIDYIKRLGETFGTNPTTEDIQEKIDFVNREVWRLMAQQVFREYFGHALESFILIDRLAYYATLVRDSPHKYIVGMFDAMSPLSPRAFSQFTLRVD